MIVYIIDVDYFVIEHLDVGSAAGAVVGGASPSRLSQVAFEFCLPVHGEAISIYFHHFVPTPRS